MAILLALTLAILGAEAAEPPPPLPSCADQLVRFSPCLPYLSSPPNNLSDSPPPKCCDAFSLSMESGGALCLCYLVQDHPMLGFPLNGSRVLPLSSTCPLRDISTNTSSAQSLESLCSGSPELPPLRSSTISEVSPPGSESVDNASSPLMSLAPESANTTNIPPGNRSPTPPKLSSISGKGFCSSEANSQKQRLVSTCTTEFPCFHVHLMLPTFIEILDENSTALSAFRILTSSGKLV